jgi:hypothetical protein
VLTDIFADRYADVVIWPSYGENDQRFLAQALRIVSDELYPYYYEGRERPAAKEAWTAIHDKLSNELGVPELSPKITGYYMPINGQNVWQSHVNTIHTICHNFMLAKFDGSVTSDRFMKVRVSFIELAFREKGQGIARANANLSRDILQAQFDSQQKKGTLRVPGNRADAVRSMNDRLNHDFKTSVDELNTRFRQAGYDLHYHNGFIQRSADPLVGREVEQPFWSLVADPIWKNVDTDIKEAIDLRDSNGRDPAFYAARALESAIKIISDQKGWTTGKEKGAHNFIDNLLSKKNGGFLKGWEATILKEFFTSVRNPFGHGAGSDEMPSLTAQQTDWSIEFCMIWIKSLVKRA